MWHVYSMYIVCI